VLVSYNTFEKFVDTLQDHRLSDAVNEDVPTPQLALVDPTIPSHA
jgi:hypothetical protein